MTHRPITPAALITSIGLLARVVALEAQANKPFPIQIAGATSDGLTLITSVPNLSRVLMLEGDTAAEVKNVRLEVSPLLAPDGSEWELHPTVSGGPAGGPFTIPRAGTASLKLEANLPVADTYTGAITFIYDNRRKSLALTVKRIRPKLPVEVLGLAGVGIRPSFWTTSGQEFWIVVQDTLGKAVDIFAPTLTSLSVGEPGKLRGQAAFDSLTVRTESGAPAGFPLTLEEGTTTRLNLSVPGLAPGAYVGSLRFSAANMQPVDKEITILVKQAGVVAVLWILLGVVASYVLRRYNKEGRPRLVLRQRAAQLARSLEAIRGDLTRVEGGPKPIETRVLEQLSRRLMRLRDDLQLKLEQNADAVLTEIQGKLTEIPHWVNLRLRVDVLEPEQLAEEFRPRIYALHELFLADTSTPEAVTAIKTAITHIEGQLAPAVRNALDALATEFERQVREQRDLASVSPDVKARLDQEVSKLLAEARAALGTEQSGRAAALIAKARVAYATILAERLKTLLEGAAQPPNRMKQPEWDTLRNRTIGQLVEVERASNAEAAVAAYETAFSDYFRGLVASLRAMIDAHVRALEQQAKSAANDLEIAAWKNALGGLDGAVAELTLKHLAGATQKYSDVAAEVEKLAPGSLGAMMRVPGVGGAAGEVPLPGAVPEGPGELRQAEHVSSRVAGETLEGITQRLELMDVAFASVIWIIAAISGLNLLWIPNPSWGGVADWFVALLWGLGLHQVGGAAFEGVGGLSDRFK